MRRQRRNLGFALLALSLTAVAACSSHQDPPDLASQLQSDTGVAWTVYRDPRSNEVRFMAPARPVQIAGNTPEEKARAFFDKYRDALHASGQPDEIDLVYAAHDQRGGVHIRFRHYLPGTQLEVFGAGSTAHFTEDGSVYWLETDFRENLAQLGATPAVDEPTAKATAEAAAQASCGGAPGAASSSALGVYADPAKPVALAYRVSVDTEGSGCLSPAVLVDARTGNVIEVTDDGRTFDVLAAGTHFWQDKQPGDVKYINVTPRTDNTAGFQLVSEGEVGTRVWTMSKSTNAVVTSPNFTDWDPAPAAAQGAAVDAQHNIEQALLFLRPFAARIDVHPRQEFAYPLAFDVAGWVHAGPFRKDGVCGVGLANVKTVSFETINIGDGGDPALCPDSMPYSAAYDVLAHEVAHIVTSHTMQPNHLDEAGALDESFADAMAASAEHAVQPDDRKNFLLGEDLFKNNGDWHQATRSMTAPRSTPPVRDRPVSPDHRDDQIPCTTTPDYDNDFCWVHSNAGIPNRAFSLLVQGGLVIPFDGTRVLPARPIANPTGIGWDIAAQIRYWATTGLSSSATFALQMLAERAEALRYAASDPAVPDSVFCAWSAVGIFDPTIESIERQLALTKCVWPAADSTPAPPPTRQGSPPSGVCGGQSDGFICDRSAPQAIECKGGSPTGNTEQCADPTLHCQPVSATDPTAVHDADGILVCE